MVSQCSISETKNPTIAGVPTCVAVYSCSLDLSLETCNFCLCGPQQMQVACCLRRRKRLPFFAKDTSAASSPPIPFRVLKMTLSLAFPLSLDSTSLSPRWFASELKQVPPPSPPLEICTQERSVLLSSLFCLRPTHYFPVFCPHCQLLSQRSPVTFYQQTQ